MDRTSLVPARMIRDWLFCPRSAVLQWVHGEWADNRFTVDGTWQHRRADRPTRDLPRGAAGVAAAGPEARQDVGAWAGGGSAGDGGGDGGGDGNADKPPIREVEGVGRVRSLYLSSEAEGVVAKMDVAEVEGDEVRPVETKRGRPARDGEAWEADRVQLGVAALILRDKGYRCQRGAVWYVSARKRVEVALDDELTAQTRRVIQQLRQAADAGTVPPPLVDSPKCKGCSLSGICLPDETRLLASLTGADADADAGTDADASAGNHGDAGASTQPATSTSVRPRRLYASDVAAAPLYVTDSKAQVGAREGIFTIRLGGEQVARVRGAETSQIAVFGRAQVTTMALRAAFDLSIPVCYFTYGGYFMGLAHGHVHKNVVLRQAQFAAAADGARSLAVARSIVAGKIRNQRTQLRRNLVEADDQAIRELKRLAGQAERADSMASLLGYEGTAAAVYFAHVPKMLRKRALKASFDWKGRNRRPPRDPVNALLSFVYSLLTKDLTATALAVGFDPYMGFYHQPRYGKPALALDLMEEFRPLVADSVVLTLLNKGEVKEGHFVSRADGCNLTSAGRKAVLRAYERRLREEIRHPLFGYRVTWRRVLEVQTRVMARWVTGEAASYVPMVTR